MQESISRAPSRERAAEGLRVDECASRCAHRYNAVTTVTFFPSAHMGTTQTTRYARTDPHATNCMRGSGIPEPQLYVARACPRASAMSAAVIPCASVASAEAPHARSAHAARARPPNAAA